MSLSKSWMPKKRNNETLSFRWELFVKILKRYQLDVRLASNIYCMVSVKLSGVSRFSEIFRQAIVRIPGSISKGFTCLTFQRIACPIGHVAVRSQSLRVILLRGDLNCIDICKRRWWSCTYIRRYRMLPSLQIRSSPCSLFLEYRLTDVHWCSRQVTLWVSNQWRHCR